MKNAAIGISRRRFAIGGLSPEPRCLHRAHSSAKAPNLLRSRRSQLNGPRLSRENVHCVAGKFHGLSGREDRLCQRLEDVSVAALRWNLSEAKAWQIRSDHPIPIGKPRDQIAILK